MVYIKHAALGNKHVPEADWPTLQSQGWVKWPRTKEQKNAAPQPSVPAGVSPAQEAGAAPDLESCRAELEAKGIPYDKRWGLKRLQEALSEHG